MKKNIILLLSVITTLLTSAQPVVYQTYHVTSTETWDINTYPDGVLIQGILIIDDGGQLTINNDVIVEFSPSKKALVQPGGKLFIYGATMKAETDHAWFGIEVRGNSDYNFNQLAYQGLIVLDNNAQIENAQHGITFVDQLKTLTGGGTGIIKNSVFKNCRFSLLKHDSPKGRLVVDNCNFIVDNDFLDLFFYQPGVGWFNPLYVRNAIEVHNTTTFIKHSTFSNLITNNNSGQFAIVVRGGNFNFTNNVINKWRGVNAVSYDPTDFITIKDNEFIESPQFCVWFGGQTNSLFLRNEFEPGAFVGSKGIYLLNSSNFIIEENIFTNNYGTGQRGIEFQETPPVIHHVYNNIFSNFGHALYSRYTSRDDQGNGLVFKCNIFSENLFDIWDGGPGNYGLAEYQGSFADEPNAPAGNQFSWMGEPNSDIFNAGKHFFYIYHDQSNLKHKPQDYTTSTVTADPNLGSNASYDEELSCPSNFPDPQLIYEIDPNVHIPQLDYSRTMTGSIKDYISHLKDGGDTEGLKSTVLASIPSEAYDLYLDLMNISPYLSNEVIKAAIQKEDVLDNAMIRDIMVANAHSAKDDDLVASLDDRITPMPEYMKDEILEGKDIASGLEVLKSGLSHYKQEAAKHFGLLKYYYMNDTVNVSASLDSLIGLLDNSGRKDAKYHLAFVYFNEQDYTSAEAVLDNIPLVLNLNTNEYDEYNSMLDYYAIRKEMQINEQSLLNADSLQLDALLDIAENGYGMAKTYACNVLSLYELCDLHEEKSMAAINKEHNRMKDLPKSHKTIKIAPNPATDIITVHYSLKGLPVNAYFQIIAYDGRIVKQVRVEKATDQKVIYIGNLNPGVYMLNLIYNQQFVESGRFIKVK